jgi:hypothetical protein
MFVSLVYNLVAQGSTRDPLGNGGDWEETTGFLENESSIVPRLPGLG